MHAKLTALLAAITAVYAPTATFAQGPAMSSAAAASAVTASPPGVFLNLREFEIPFSVDSSGARPAHVELFVSRDQGQRWSLSARQPATGRHFQFTAPDDGHYWFATRTIDVAGNPHPAGNQIAPQLHVTIDTARPQLTLRAEVDAAGRVLLNYVYADAAPSDDQFQLQYMTDINRSQWYPVVVSSQGVESHADGTRRGQIQFLPEGNWRYLNVRLVAVDRAGNQTVVVEQVERPRIAGTPARLASGRGPGENDGGYAMQTPQPPPAASPAPQALQIPAAGASPARSQTNPYAGGYAGSARVPGGYRGWDGAPPGAVEPPLPATDSVRATPVSQPVEGSLGGTSTGGGSFYRQPPSLSPPAVNAPAPTNGFESNRQGVAGPATGPIPPSSAMRPISIESLPTPVGEPDHEHPTARAAVPSAAPYVPAPAPSPTPAASSGGEIAPHRQVDESEIRQSRSRQFSLDYEVESVGSKGIDEVELWASSDGGHSWSNWGSDPDRQSPFDIETVNSGLYGFCIVVVGGNGLTSRRPQPGDQADIYVRVDTTPPVARLTAARYGEGDEAGSLVIEYEYEDENPISRPVSLSFSENPAGPWTTIATGLEDTGRYAWPADPRLPRQIYLRVEAIDRAGNVGTEARDTPVAVQGLAPRARIRGFQPIGP